MVTGMSSASLTPLGTEGLNMRLVQFSLALSCIPRGQFPPALDISLAQYSLLVWYSNRNEDDRQSAVEV